MKRARHPVKYHGRTGRPVVHSTGTGRRFMMARAKGGGTRRVYEGSKIRTNKPRRGEKPRYAKLVLS